MQKVPESKGKVTDEADASGASGWRRQGHVPEAEGLEISGGRQAGWWRRLRVQVVRLAEEERKRGREGSHSYSEFSGGQAGGKAICSGRPG